MSQDCGAYDSPITAWRAHDPTIHTAAALTAELTAGTLPEAFDRGAAAHPDSVLTVGDGTRTLGELVVAARRWAGALEAAGVLRGQPVVLQAATSGTMVCAYLGLLITGAPVVLMSPALTTTEFAAIADKSGATLAITDGPVPGQVRRLSIDELAENARHATEKVAVATDPNDTALIAFTSGTTGQPKGVPLTHANLLASVRAVMRAWRWTSADRLVHALPLYHQHGLSGLHATLIAGSSAHILGRFDAVRLAATIRAQHATVLFGVPTIYQGLVDAAGVTAEMLDSLRLATSGSAPLSVGLFHRVQTELGVTPLERYGLTETGLDVSNLYDGPRRPGAVGYPLPGVEVRLGNPDGTPAESGQGEILLRGPQVFAGYLDDPAATAAAFTAEGWFRTGDLGTVLDDGALAVTGRIKEIIVTGGINVSPVEVEEVLTTHPAVTEAGVAGVPDDRWGEAVAAWVVVQCPVDIDDLLAHCRERLAPFKCPKRITTVEHLPRNAMGKIQRNRLVAKP
ncbi:class I adenylate-forming enzyme family protein [Mycolicibacterium vaccae]|uniref:class I adenylate-forming enzyme family protein n=1 Tax=Mycolicibacterium vaccae TaxID=1810 RepID=UPI003D04A7E1